MKSLVSSAVFLAVMLAAVNASAQRYGWTISSSSTDPFVNSGPFSTALFLHLQCQELPTGAITAEFDLSNNLGLVPLAFIPQGGWVNVGGANNLQLSHPTCQTSSSLVGLIVTFGSGEMCIVPSTTGTNGTTDCFVGALHPNLTVGFNTLGPPACDDRKATPWICQPAHQWGACCVPDGSCVDVGSFVECQSLGGSFQGHPSGCDLEACCLPDGSCVMTSRTCSECVTLGGDPQGIFSNCASCPTTSVEGSIESESWGRTKAAYRR